MQVTDFRDFYQTPRGVMASGLIRRQLQGLTLPRPGQTVMGLGFAPPYLAENHPDIRTLSFMLARQGVIHWPTTGAVRSALVDDEDLPLLESVIDIALLVHGLELADTPLHMLQEVWRVMAPQGRLLLVVPNRRGLWAASESTPFGHGQPFSAGQVARLLKEAKFTPTHWRSALYLPPFRYPGLLKTGPVLDAAGQRMVRNFAGVFIVEAMKQVYAFSSGKRVRRFMPRLRPALLPSPQPSPKRPK